MPNKISGRQTADSQRDLAHQLLHHGAALCLSWAWIEMAGPPESGERLQPSRQKHLCALEEGKHTYPVFREINPQGIVQLIQEFDELFSLHGKHTELSGAAEERAIVVVH